MAILTGGDAVSLVEPTEGDDILNGGNSQDHIRAGAGADTVNGGGAADGIFGGAGDDILNGDAGDDFIGGGFGADTLNGGDGRDSLTGSGTAMRYFTTPPNTFTSEPYRFEFFDRFANDGSVDILNGGAGADTIVVAFGDQADGGTSADDIDQLILVFTGMPALNINLSTQSIQQVASLINATVANFEWYGVVATEHADVVVGTAEADLVWGQQGDDELAGGGGADLLVGGTGADHLQGGDGNDSLYHDGALNSRGGVSQGSEDGAVDTLEGGEGNDVIYIGYNDVADGGNGSDTVFGAFTGSSVGITLNLTGDSRTILANALGATLSNFENFSLVGSAFNDVLTGNAGTTNLTGDAGDDILDGGDGNDQLRGGTGRDVLYGGVGNDLLFGGAGADTFYGGPGNDQIFGDFNNDNSPPGYNGPDTVIYAGPRSSYSISQDLRGWVISGPDGTDTLYEIERVQFSDMTLIHQFLGPGGVIHDGDASANTIFGTPDGDDIRGGGGDDVIRGSDGGDVIDGGEGFDTLTFEGQDGRVFVDLTAIDYQARKFGAALTTSIERFIGGLEDDQMSGDAAANVFEGREGDDSLSGLGGADRLVGGSGDDTLDGGLGSDTAVFSGVRDDYDIVADDDGVLTITDLRADGDGVDTVTGVEVFVFSDGTYAYADLVGPYAPVADALEVTLGQASSLDAAILLANDANATDGTLTGVRNAVGATVALVDGRLVIVASAANASFEYTALDGDGIERVGTVSVLARTATAGADTLTGSGAVAASDLVGIGGSDVLTGGAGRDRLVGGAGNDRLDGGAGADLLVGGIGSDTYRVDNAGDVVVELAGEGTDTVETSLSGYTLADNTEKLVLLAGVLAGTGNALANTLVGNDGDNLLDGGAGADLMQGGAGDDTYVVDDAGDVVQETTGFDTVRTALAAYTLGARVEALVYTGTGDFQGTGSAIANTLAGGAGDDILDGGLGADTLRGGAGDDLYLVDNLGDVIDEAFSTGGDDEVRASISYVLTAGARVETLSAAGTRVINLTGNAFAQTLVGNDAANLLDGGGGADTLAGGLGDDTYVITDEDNAVTVVESAGAGYDTVRSSIDHYTLAANVEQLILFGNAITAIGNDQNNLLIGTSGNNHLIGGAGADTLVGGLGDDNYDVDNAGDVIVESGSGRDFVMVRLNSYTLAALVEDMAFWDGGGAFNGTGNSLNNTIQGGSLNDTLSGLGGDDRLDGNAGADTMNGGLGNDLYIVDDAGDLVIDAGVGVDTVQASIASYTLTANVENLFMYRAGSTGVGNSLNNILTGAAGSQTLSGLDGADRLLGMEGDDTLLGGAGADYLDGGAGIDNLQGGAGDDTYILGFQDTIVELANEGIDTVRTDVITLTLGANLENLVYIGGAGTDWTGNALVNSMTGGDYHDQMYGRGGDDKLFGLGGVDYLYGDDGNDTIDGGLGGDLMFGGLGNDIYIVDDVGDEIGEYAGEGTDTARVSLNTYTLAENVETLLFVGTGRFDGTGNDLANTIVGGAGADTLFGGGGADTLRGGGEGDGLRGGEGNDKLYGEVGIDYLYGEEGNDYLYGGAGADFLDGGAGKDYFLYTSVSESFGDGADRDVIVNFETVDVINLSAIDADTTQDGNQAFTFIGGNAFSGVPGEVQYVSGHLYADVDGDGVGDLHIKLENSAHVTAANLIL